MQTTARKETTITVMPIAFLRASGTDLVLILKMGGLFARFAFNPNSTRRLIHVFGNSLSVDLSSRLSEPAEFRCPTSSPGCCRMTMRYRTTRADDAGLRQRMRAIAQERRPVEKDKMLMSQFDSRLTITIHLHQDRVTR